MELVGVAEIAELLGVSRPRAHQLIEAYDDFPKPVSDLSVGRVWARAAVELWVALHPDRRPGRPAANPIDFERFSEDARRAVQRAVEEAKDAEHGAIGIAHVLLGLAADAGGLAARALDEFGATA